jgi:hypothetical protein
MKIGVLCFHQGWTDIVNCLSLITYYSLRLEKLFVIIREEAKEIVEYYSKNLSNVIFEYAPAERVKSTLEKIKKQESNEVQILFHGSWDSLRNDRFKEKFSGNSLDNLHFVERFYECYEIPVMEKVNSFSLTRDKELEDKFYEDFVQKNGHLYSLVHDSQERKISNVKNAVMLNDLTKNFFIAAKILENSNEIHVIDSVWASVCYQLDSRFGLLKNKCIFVYPFKDRAGCFFDPSRSLFRLFPIELSNWTIIPI